jgi:hypothetical protein
VTENTDLVSDPVAEIPILGLPISCSHNGIRLGLPNTRFRCNMTFGEGADCMRSIDIDSLSEDELIELNHKVVARLRFLSQMRSHSAMLDFRIGERVKFHPTGGPELTGILTRYNKKTVTVVTDSGQHWNVAPGLLSRVDAGSAGNQGSDVTGVVRFPNRT